jgi:hypothetical protein
VEAQGRNLSWRDKEGKRYKTYAPEDPEMIKLLRDKKVVINAKKEEEEGTEKTESPDPHLSRILQLAGIR